MRFWCEALEQTITVFGVFHGFEEDLPSGVGFKKPPGTPTRTAIVVKGRRGRGGAGGIWEQAPAASIATKKKWFWHTNAADRFRFLLNSVFLLAPFVKESLTVDFALWKVHVRFVQLLAQPRKTPT